MAAERLGVLGNTRAVEPLIEALQDKELSVREAAANALGRIGDERAIGPLTRALTPYGGAIKEAAQALPNIGGNRAIDALIGALKQKDDYVVYEVILALGNVKNPRVMAPLIEAMVRGVSVGGYRERYKKFAEVLKPFGKPAIDSLVDIIKDLSRRGRGNAAELLDNLGWQSANDVEWTYWFIAHEYYKSANRIYWETCQSKGTAAFETLLPLLGTDEGVYIYELLLMTGGGRAVELLIGELKSGRFRESAARVLANSKDHRAVEALIETLKSGPQPLRKAAAESLSKIGDGKAVEPLTAALLNDDSWEVRQTAAEALCRLSEARAIRPLIAALADKKLHNSGGVVRTLQRMLEQDVEKISVADLRSLASLNSFVEIGQHSDKCGWTYEREVDCSPLKQLARQELIRRGLEA
jgi:HEAT repeat protein